MERLLRATDPASVPKSLSAEERIKRLEAQNQILRFHFTTLIKHAGESSPETLVKKKR